MNTNEPGRVVPAAEVTLWTLSVDDRHGTCAYVFYTEAEVTESLRESYAPDEDVSDADLPAYLNDQGVSYQVQSVQMNTTMMRNQP